MLAKANLKIYTTLKEALEMAQYLWSHIGFIFAAILLLYFFSRVYVWARWTVITRRSVRLSQDNVDLKPENTSFVIIAGGEGGVEKQKALWKFKRGRMSEMKPLLHIVIDVAMKTGFDDIVVVCHLGVWQKIAARLKSPKVHFIKQSETGEHSQNVLLGLGAAKHKSVILSGCDTPLISASAIRNFLSDCIATPLLTIGYSVADAGECARICPGRKFTKMSLWGEILKGGSLIFVAHTLTLLVKPDFIKAICAAKKDKLRLAMIIGFSTAIKFILAKRRPWILSRADLERAMTWQFNSCVCGIKIPALAAVDADNIEELEVLGRIALDNS